MKMDRRQVKAYALALEEIGMQEIRGPVDNPEIVQMFAEVGHPWVKDDETAWCAAFIGAMLERAGLPSTRKLNARSYLEWGEVVDRADAKAGDVVVFWRGSRAGWQGHVAFLSRDAGRHLEVVGGNQSNMVNVAPYRADRLLGIRRWPAPSKPPTSPRAPIATPAQGVQTFFEALARMFRK